jgi:hypothetical protein
VTGCVMAYLRQRFPWPVFVPVIATLAALSYWATAVPWQLATAGRVVLFTLGLVVLLRLWDDLEDRDHDRVAHPERLLPQQPVGGFMAMQVILASGLAGVWLWSGAIDAVMWFAALIVAAGTAYWVLRPRLSPAAWSYLLLLKYPVIVATVAYASGDPRPGRLVVAILVTYGGACVYEDLHDHIRRAHSRGAIA